MSLNLNNFHLAKSFGKIVFCKNVINPKFDIKIEKKAKEGAADAKDGGKGKGDKKDGNADAAKAKD